MRQNGHELRSSVATIGAGWMAVSAVLAALGVHAGAMAWLRLARGIGLTAPAPSALGMYYVSQLGKYVPGAVWPVVAQVEFGRRFDVPRRALIAAYALVVLVLCSTGLVLGATVLLAVGSSGTATRYLWPLVLVPVLVAALHPRAVPHMLNRAMAWTGYELPQVKIRPSVIRAAVAWSFVSWVLLGLHLAVLVASLGASGPRLIALSVGAMAFGWAAGLLAVVAPAGVGVRDSILIAAFAGLIGGSAALGVALASRILLLLADLALAALGLLLTARSKQNG